MRSPNQIIGDIETTESLLKTANRRYNAAVRHEMTSNTISFDSIDYLTDVNTYKNQLVELRKELNEVQVL